MYSIKKSKLDCLVKLKHATKRLLCSEARKKNRPKTLVLAMLDKVSSLAVEPAFLGYLIPDLRNNIGASKTLKYEPPSLFRERNSLGWPLEDPGV